MQVSKLVCRWEVKGFFPLQVCQCMKHLVMDGFEYVPSPAPSPGASPLVGSSGVHIPMAVPLPPPPKPPPTRRVAGSARTTRAKTIDPRKAARADPRKRKRGGAASVDVTGEKEKEKEKEKVVVQTYGERETSMAHERLSSGLRNVKVRPLNVNSMAPLAPSASRPAGDDTDQRPARVETFHFTLYPGVVAGVPRPVEVRSVSEAELRTAC